MSLIAHLIPEPRRQPSIAYAPAPKEPEQYYEERRFEQTAELPAAPKRPGMLKNLAANIIAGTGDTLELARERRQQLREARQAPPLIAEPELPPTQVQEEPESPKTGASLVEEQAN
jgi:hypothetical protein